MEFRSQKKALADSILQGLFTAQDVSDKELFHIHSFPDYLLHFIN